MDEGDRWMVFGISLQIFIFMTHMECGSFTTGGLWSYMASAEIDGYIVYFSLTLDFDRWDHFTAETFPVARNQGPPS